MIKDIMTHYYGDDCVTTQFCEECKKETKYIGHICNKCNLKRISKNKEKQEWEKEFDTFILAYESGDLFNLLSAIRAKYGDVALDDFLGEIKNFISNLLQKQKEKAIQIIEDMERGGLLDEHEDLVRANTLLETIKNLKERL